MNPWSGMTDLISSKNTFATSTRKNMKAIKFIQLYQKCNALYLQQILDIIEKKKMEKEIQIK